jgi:beta-phosphoglucomutase-like phosphatase (HAD superfamily)
MSRAKLPLPEATATADDNPAEIEPFSLAATRMDTFPSECAIFVNTPDKIRAALDAGAGKVIAICGTHSRKELEEHGAHYVLDSLRKVECLNHSNWLELHITVPDSPVSSAKPKPRKAAKFYY